MHVEKVASSNTGVSASGSPTEASLAVWNSLSKACITRMRERGRLVDEGGRVANRCLGWYVRAPLIGVVEGGAAVDEGRGSVLSAANALVDSDAEECCTSPVPSIEERLPEGRVGISE